MDKAEFLDSIDFDASLDEDIVKRIYGYCLHDPQFLVDVMLEYEKHGRNNVKYVYTIWVNLYKLLWDREMKPIARELSKQIDSEYESKVNEYERKVKEKNCKKEQEKLTKGQVARQILNW